MASEVLVRQSAQDWRARDGATDRRARYTEAAGAWLRMATTTALVAIARHVSAGKHVVLADRQPDNADAAARILSDAGFEVSTATVDVSSRQ